jgi:hypothetical protein
VVANLAGNFRCISSPYLRITTSSRVLQNSLFSAGEPLWLDTTAISLQCHSACHKFLWVSIGSYSSPLASSTVHQRRCLDRLTARWKNIRNSGANGFLTSCQLVQPASLMSQYREHARFPSSNSFRRVILEHWQFLSFTAPCIRTFFRFPVHFPVQRSMSI